MLCILCSSFFLCLWRTSCCSCSFLLLLLLLLTEQNTSIVSVDCSSGSSDICTLAIACKHQHAYRECKAGSRLLHELEVYAMLSSAAVGSFTCLCVLRRA